MYTSDGSDWQEGSRRRCTTSCHLLLPLLLLLLRLLQRLHARHVLDRLEPCICGSLFRLCQPRRCDRGMRLPQSPPPVIVRGAGSHPQLPPRCSSPTILVSAYRWRCSGAGQGRRLRVGQVQVAAVWAAAAPPAVNMYMYMLWSE